MYAIVKAGGRQEKVAVGDEFELGAHGERSKTTTRAREGRRGAQQPPHKRRAPSNAPADLAMGTTPFKVV